MSSEFYTLPGLPSDLLTSDIAGFRALKVESKEVVENPNRVDAFARLRVSEPTAIWYDTLEHDLSPFLWSQTSQGAESQSEHVPSSSAARMTVGSNQGDYIRRTTRLPIRYQPGKSRLDMFTWGELNISNGVRFNVGAFCCGNGVFFSIKDGDISCVVRSSVSGTEVDRVTPRSQWNYDRLDGTGPSGVTLDLTKAQIGFIDLEWLSVGNVRFSLVIGGQPLLVHIANHANNLHGAYMTTANLPIQYELINEDGGQGGEVLAICSASMSEGGSTEERGYLWSASNGRAGVAVPASDTWTPIISIRRAETFKGISYKSGIIVPRLFESFCTGSTIQLGVFYRPTLTGGAWVQVNAESGVERNATATAMTDGILVQSSYVAAGGQGSGAFATATDIESSWLLPIANDWEGGNADVVTVAARALTSAATAYAAIDYKEVR